MPRIGSTIAARSFHWVVGCGADAELALDRADALRERFLALMRRVIESKKCRARRAGIGADRIGQSDFAKRVDSPTARMETQREARGVCERDVRFAAPGAYPPAGAGEIEG